MTTFSSARSRMEALDWARTIAITAAGGSLAVLCAGFHRPGDAEFDPEPLSAGEVGEFYGWAPKGMGNSGHRLVAQSNIKQVEDFALHGGNKTLSTELANGAKSQPGDSSGRS